MRLSTSLSRNIMEATVGGILYKFKLRGRRHTLFFEEILANCIKEREERGHAREIEKVAQEWGALIIKGLAPHPLKKLPQHIFMGLIMKRIWTNLGLIDNLNMIKKDDTVELKTKNEAITRLVGENRMLLGFYKGVLGMLYGVQLECTDFLQTKASSKYRFNLGDLPFSAESKDIGTYMKLNHLPKIEGITLKDAIKNNVFQLKKDNRLYFRGTPLVPIENTVFHLTANCEILVEQLPNISYTYFSGIIDEFATKEEKLVLLKNILQAMGWGTITILIKNESEILIEIRNPPYGLQLEKDNWNFLIKTILGYLWVIDRSFEIEDIVEPRMDSKKLKILFRR